MKMTAIVLTLIAVFGTAAWFFSWCVKLTGAEACYGTVVQVQYGGTGSIGGHDWTGVTTNRERSLTFRRHRSIVVGCDVVMVRETNGSGWKTAIEHRGYVMPDGQVCK